MKGAVGLCFIFSVIYITGAAIIKTQPEQKVLTLGSSSQLLLSCVVDTAATFTDFKWTYGVGTDKPKELCRAATQKEDCTISSDVAPLFETKSPKYNLHVTSDKKVNFQHAASYSCELTANSESEKYIGDITVVADRVVCPTNDVNRPKGTRSTISCTIEYKGAQAPNLTIGGNGAVHEDIYTTDEGVITRKAKLDIIPTADTSYECRYNNNITCPISVKPFPSRVATYPESVTWAKVNTTTTIPCTMKPNQHYTAVVWYRMNSDGSQTKICSGSASATGSCTTKGYSLDDNQRHDLTVNNATTDHIFKYTCNVETTNVKQTETYVTQVAVLEDPVCQGSIIDNKPTLSCTIQLKGTDEKPTMKWFDGTNEVTKSVIGAVPTGDDWKNVTLTAPSEKVTTEYVCKVFRDTTATSEIASCKQAGVSTASAISVKFFQSWMMSLIIFFILNQFK